MNSFTNTLTANRSIARGAAAPRPSFVVRAGRALWNALEQAGARRARAELLRLADEHERSRPEFAAQLRRAARRGWL